uniref:long-chain-fatty-acid--CoA ligase n=1 Tax=Mola mola TaxID=94237 RepID=A0A3Q4BDJ7_MOLML
GISTIPVCLCFYILNFNEICCDVQHVHNKLKARRRVQKYARTNYTILDRFLEVVKAQPHKPFLRFKDETFTYQDADELSNKAARVFLQSGRVREGDTVALFLGNEPTYLWLWLALMKIGCTAAFLNHNIRSKSLLHCFSRCGARALVAAAELQDALEEVLPSLLEQQVDIYILADGCKSPDIRSFRDQMSQASCEPMSKDLRSHLNLGSVAVYIYTSGTTGLPKAAEVTHAKLWYLVLLLSVSSLKSNDVIYTTLPLYHTAGFLGVISAIEMGLTVALRSKFSATQFWDDCRKYDVTVVQYIGEILRYLCNTPKKPNDRSHKVRLAVGNGIRAEVWRDFISRFGNIQIKEFYGATEGNFALLNYTGKIGAIGRDTFLHKWYFPYSLIKYDVDQETPLRGSAGFCIEAARGEPGLLVCEISPDAPFSGYVRDLQQTEKKKLHNVHKKGDVYFNTGDVLSIDEDGFFYFQDRVGDTFRWKGENVSTAEVADILTLINCIKEATVYGVRVPGLEGRAGMAAITLKEGQRFDSVGVFKHVEQYLPTYARPRFIRIQSSLDVTGTFKYVKVSLVEEGFNPRQITELLYFLDEKVRDYVPLTLDVFNSISSGKIKI